TGIASLVLGIGRVFICEVVTGGLVVGAGGAPVAEPVEGVGAGAGADVADLGAHATIVDAAAYRRTSRRVGGCIDRSFGLEPAATLAAARRGGDFAVMADGARTTTRGTARLGDRSVTFRSHHGWRRSDRAGRGPATALGEGARSEPLHR